MADLNAYTVIADLDLSHCEEGKHEHFGPCPDCDDKGMQVADAAAGTFKKCKTCGGTRQGGPSLGLRDCDLPATRYVPGQTIHLSASAAAPLIKAKLLADPKAPTPIDEQIAVAAAERFGYSLSKPL